MLADRIGCTHFETARFPLHGLPVSSYSMPALRGGDGGDWCEAFALPDDRIALSIGDVSGHDLAAALPMTRIRAMIRREAALGAAPAELLARANAALCRDESARHATAIFATVDLTNRELTFANAGHPKPLLVRRGAIRHLGAGAGAMPFGVTEDLQLRSHVVPLEAETLLMLYTDGVVEFDERSHFGQRRLHFAARRAHGAVGDAAKYIADQLRLPARFHDDASVLAVRVLGSPAPSYRGGSGPEYLAPSLHAQGGRRKRGAGARFSAGALRGRASGATVPSKSADLFAGRCSGCGFLRAPRQ